MQPLAQDVRARQTGVRPGRCAIAGYLRAHTSFLHPFLVSLAPSRYDNHASRLTTDPSLSLLLSRASSSWGGRGCRAFVPPGRAHTSIPQRFPPA